MSKKGETGYINCGIWGQTSESADKVGRRGRRRAAAYAAALRRPAGPARCGRPADSSASFAVVRMNVRPAFAAAPTARKRRKLFCGGGMPNGRKILYRRNLSAAG